MSKSNPEGGNDDELGGQEFPDTLWSEPGVDGTGKKEKSWIKIGLVTDVQRTGATTRAKTWDTS